ncbi:unnamed protein product, partial [Adineta steineri]
MRRISFFDILPVEILHTLFTYFLAHEVLFSFLDVSDYVNNVILAYSAYQVDLKSIRKTHFDLICQHIRPEQIISLRLSDDKDTPGLSELFFSRFQIEQFIHLRSLKLIEIEYESMDSIFSYLHQLKQLRSFSFNVDSIRQKYPTRTNSYLNMWNQVNLLLSNTYLRVLPQITYLYLHNGNVLHSIPLPVVYHLKLDKCSLDDLKVIFKNAPEIQSLNICLKLETPTLNISSISSPPLTKLNLKITNSPVSMNEMESFLLNLPYLKHLKLELEGDNDLANGHRWQMLTGDFITFAFKFHVEVGSVNETLQSFRTLFWLEEKR